MTQESKTSPRFPLPPAERARLEIAMNLLYLVKAEIISPAAKRLIEGAEEQLQRISEGCH